MTTICGVIDSAFKCLSSPFQSSLRTPVTGRIACCANGAVASGSIASIIAGVMFGSPAGIAIGSVVCPIATLNTCLSRDYSVIQDIYKNLKSQNDAMVLIQQAAEEGAVSAAAVTAAGVDIAAAAADLSEDVEAGAAQVSVLRQEVERLKLGRTTLQAELDQVRGELANIISSKDELSRSTEELRGANVALREVAARIEGEASALRVASQAKDRQNRVLQVGIEKLGSKISRAQGLTLQFASLMAIQQALMKFRSEDLDGYTALIARFPGLALPV